MRKFPKPGDRVRVPFGLDILEGVVWRVSELGKGAYVTVAVEIDGSDEPIVTTYSPDDIEMAAAA